MKTKNKLICALVTLFFLLREYITVLICADHFDTIAVHMTGEVILLGKEFLLVSLTALSFTF